MKDKDDGVDGPEPMPAFEKPREYIPTEFAEPPVVRLKVTGLPELVVTDQTEVTVTDLPKLVVTESQAQEVTTQAQQIATTHAEGTIDKVFAPTMNSSATATEYDTTAALKKGLFGEKMAADALAQQGHVILDFKPDIRGTNQGGIDIVTMKDGIVYFIDNKAYTTGKNIGSISALMENFEKNKQAVLDKFEAFSKDPGRATWEQQLWEKVIATINEGNWQKASTSAGLAKDGKHSQGVTPALQNEIEHINVIDPAAASPQAGYTPVPTTLTTVQPTSGQPAPSAPISALLGWFGSNFGSQGASPISGLIGWSGPKGKS